MSDDSICKKRLRKSLIMGAKLHNRDLFKQFPFCNVGW
jgi:hypothetical protein